MEFQNDGGVFINGRAQILEMFQYLTSEERNRLLRQIRMRNPGLADEIMQTALTYESLATLHEEAIERVLSYCKAPILGVALKSLNVKDQRKILSVCPRDFAEEAYKVMTTRLSNETRDVERACSKIAAIIGALVKKKIISL
jgi:flagellar motor switch protein FliG